MALPRYHPYTLLTPHPIPMTKPFPLLANLRLGQFRDDNKHMNQFVIHSSLDIVEEVQWISNTMYVVSRLPFPPRNKKPNPRPQTSHLCLSFRTPRFILASPWVLSDHTGNRYMKTVDNFNNKLISAFVTAGSKPHLSFFPSFPLLAPHFPPSPFISAFPPLPFKPHRYREIKIPFLPRLSIA
jgi:hypothetical protein